MSRIEYGITFPAGQQAHERLADYVARADAIGFDALWVIDNLSGGTPGFDPLTVLTYAAAASSTLRLGTSVLIAPLRNPVLLAQSAAAIDLLSDGRLTLGLGVGDPAIYTAVGADPSTRGARCEEAVELLKRLFAGGPVSHAGRFTTLDAYELTPRPFRDAGPPIWLGGHSDPAYDRAARLADGFIPVGVAPAAAKALFDRLDAAAADHGREDPRLARAAHVYLGMDERLDRALESTARTLTRRYGRPATAGDADAHLLGPPGRCAEVLAGFRDAGVRHFIFDPVCPPEAVAEQLSGLRRLLED